MKKILNIVEDCASCTKFTKCKASKNFTAKQRFLIKTSPAYRGILKECDLETYDPAIKKALQKIFDMLNNKELNIKSFEFQLYEIARDGLKSE